MEGRGGRGGRNDWNCVRLYCTTATLMISMCLLSPRRPSCISKLAVDSCA